VGPRDGLDRCGKSRPTGIRSPDRPARSQSLYRLSYPAHFSNKWLVNNLFIDTVPVTVTCLMSNYKNDYEEEQKSAGK
jgi:hypothetical protein